MKTVNTIALIITKDNSLLVEKRRMDKKTDPGAVIIPGGHVEQGETHTEACRRELREELDLECNRFTYITKELWKTPIENQLTHYYLCEGWTGKPRCLEAEEIYYISYDNIEKLDFGVDRRAVRAYLSKL